jgi:hypothetical protein
LRFIIYSLFCDISVYRKPNKTTTTKKRMNTNTEHDDVDDDDAVDSMNSPDPPTFQETIEDLANWWCHCILQNKDLQLFEELEPLLELLSPLESRSPFCIRLHCLAVWQELLKQTVGRTQTNNNNNDDDDDDDDDDDSDNTRLPPPALKQRDFSVLQDRIVLLHNDFFSQNQSTPIELYQEVVRLVRVHDELSSLYKFLDDDDQRTEEEISARLEESLQKGRDEIYFGDQQVIPEELKELVDQDNGWDASERKEYIRRLVFDNESRLCCKELQHKMQLLLLHWCEWQLGDGTAPELVQLGYRDLSTKTSPPTQDDNNNHNENRRPQRRRVTAAAPFAERSREQHFDSDDDDTKNAEEDDPPPPSANRKHSLEEGPPSASSSSTTKRRRMTEKGRRQGFSEDYQMRRGGRFGSPAPRDDRRQGQNDRRRGEKRSTPSNHHDRPQSDEDRSLISSSMNSKVGTAVGTSWRWRKKKQVVWTVDEDQGECSCLSSLSLFYARILVVILYEDFFPHFFFTRIWN